MCMITNNISWSLGSTPNKSLVCLEPTAVGPVTSLLFRFTSRVTHSQHRDGRAPYFPSPELPLAPAPTQSASRTTSNCPPLSRSISNFHASISPDRSIASVTTTSQLNCNTSNSLQPVPITPDRSDRFFNFNQLTPVQLTTNH